MSIEYITPITRTPEQMEKLREMRQRLRELDEKIEAEEAKKLKEPVKEDKWAGIATWNHYCRNAGKGMGFKMNPLQLPKSVGKVFVRYKMSSFGGVYMWFKPKGKVKTKEHNEKCEKLVKKIERAVKKQGREMIASCMMSGMVKVHFDNVNEEDMKK